MYNFNNEKSMENGAASDATRVLNNEEVESVAGGLIWPLNINYRIIKWAVNKFR